MTEVRLEVTLDWEIADGRGVVDGDQVFPQDQPTAEGKQQALKRSKRPGQQFGRRILARNAALGTNQGPDACAMAQGGRGPKNLMEVCSVICRDRAENSVRHWTCSGHCVLIETRPRHAQSY